MIYVLLQCFMQRVVDIDQHPVVIIFLEPWFDLRVKVTKQRTDISLTLHFEVAQNSITMTVQVSALIHKGFISVSCIKLILLLNHHENVLTAVDPHHAPDLSSESVRQIC